METFIDDREDDATIVFIEFQSLDKTYSAACPMKANRTFTWHPIEFMSKEADYFFAMEGACKHFICI